MSDERLKRPVDSLRQDTRLVETIEREADQEASDDVRLEQMLDEFSYDALPTPPELPGFHLCWLSTTHGADSIAKRQRMGYVAVKPEELGKDWDAVRMNSGQWNGYVGVNEMILFKIPEPQYQALMRHFHHTLPGQEEVRLRQNLESARQGLGTGRQIVAEVGDGTASHGAIPQAPRRFT